VQVFDRWEEVERLFHAALGQDPAHRTEFLSRICTDPDLLAEVNSLLEAHEKGGSLLDGPPDKLAAEFLEEIDAQQESLVGSCFDHYEITGVLGEGGMGKVYLAQDSRLMRKVALKLLPAPHVQSLERLRRFAQEARVASALNHPNIITVYDYGQAFSSYYIATEYVEGRTLRSLIGGGIDFRSAIEIGIQMASAFAAAHQAGIIHRDIKPENIMIRSDGLVKVLDFGLAKLSSQSESMTRLGDSPASVPGAVMGTFCYMSPEQARGKELDARTDIFSFGIVMYEMLAGRRPFDGETLPDLLSSLVGSDPPAISTYIPDAPPELDAILAAMLARDRDQRYQTFEDVLGDLISMKKRLALGEAAPAAAWTQPGPQAGRISSGQSEVQKLGSNNDAVDKASHAPSLWISLGATRTGRYLMLAVVIVVAVVVAYEAIGKRILHPAVDDNVSRAKGFRIDPSQVSQPLRITDDGKASSSGISVTRDGRLFAYVGRSGLSVLAMPASEQDTPREILNTPCSDCKGVTFSPDGAFVYYVAPEGARKVPSLYRRSLATNSEEKIKEGLNRTISFSPDGKKFVFVRNRDHALMIADADGSKEESLTTLEGADDLWLYPAWSPDGKTVACGVMKQNAKYQQIYAVKTEDGSKAAIGSTKWVNVLNLAWMSDGAALIVNAADDRGPQPGLWEVSYPDGNATKITNDLSGYYGAGLTADSRTLLSVRGDVSASLYTLDATNPGSVRKINLGLLNNCGLTGVCWTPGGGIICSAGPPEGKALYAVEAAGPNRSEPRRLTSSGGINNSPWVTADGRQIVFTSDREGRLSLWRMDINGDNPAQLTSEGLNGVCSPDGTWIVYQVATNEHTRLWRISMEGGQAAPVTEPDVDAENAAVSPDGRRVACLMRAGDMRPQIAVMALREAGRAREFFRLPESIRQPIIRWRDDQTLAYVDQRGDGSDIWIQDVGPSRSPQSPRQLFGPVTHPMFNVIFNFDWARNGQIVLSAGNNSRDVVKLVLMK
jgi:serine/threonine protein kinase/Tol biopolymer transport system component